MANRGNLGNLLPMYILVDESASMAPYMSDLNTGMKSLYTTLIAEPMTAAKLRLSVLGFSDTVIERLHLADLRSVAEMPPFAHRSSTDYGTAFQFLLRQIPLDVDELKSKGHAVHRPAVVFLSDGQPTTSQINWKDRRAILLDRSVTPAAPNIVACGIGDAEASTILEVATNTSFAFVTIHGADVGEAIAKFCSTLTNSIVQSGRSVGTGKEELVFDKPEGFRMAIDVI